MIYTYNYIPIILAASVVTPIQPKPKPPPSGKGIIRYVYRNTRGITTVDEFRSYIRPRKVPSFKEVIGIFSAPKNLLNNYGQRLITYFEAPRTGKYVFYLSADDKGQLWVGKTRNPSSKVRIVNLRKPTRFNTFLRCVKVFSFTSLFYCTVISSVSPFSSKSTEYFFYPHMQPSSEVRPSQTQSWKLLLHRGYSS